MAGTPRKRAKIEELEAKVPKPKPPRAATGTPFDADRAREAAQASAEARRRRREVPQDEITSIDEASAIAVLRKNMRSSDEKVAHAAALRVLEYTKGKPGGNSDEVTAVIFETHFISPPAAHREADPPEVLDAVR